MANITILGAGMIGSALTVPLTDNGHHVNLVGSVLDDPIIEQINTTGTHPGLLLPLSQNVTPFTSDRFDEALEGTEMLVIAVNSMGIDWAAMTLEMALSMNDTISELPLLFLTKGLEPRTDGNRWVSKNERLQILPEALKEQLSPENQNRVRCAAVGGPSIAKELADRQHTSVVVAAEEQALVEQIADLIRTPYHHVWTSTDLVGIEVCATLKNLYALAIGIVGGLHEKDGLSQLLNAEAAIFAQSIAEMSYFVAHMGGQQTSVITLPGAGDLYVTAKGGRNGRMGRLLGLGQRYTDAKKQHMPTETVEGAEIALSTGTVITRMVHDGKLDAAQIPLLMMVLDIVCNDQPVTVPWEAFFAG